ncbi:MAG: Zn-ribbon domain-containing OB-fold protein [Armatimonadota bacterium]|nr:Zn-ribbon domain-containing OB-fold protein [Armatimonadota bacterium]MDR7400647.1 Zn-ribbon domain-containing OB-fold protein [Armatimonadota bacterium]MDR7403175.1 Zn-ribbon domain-containing OB-fold protein [Armatimonadota bacterium]MDR7436542.1 Zn-ribbon domain-containing OB-fold protein [Armatimonadota bacterium]MDR7472577.1 Zn-ribbon domain-containing OB-fold protein [Armatimonadota bacterium]
MSAPERRRQAAGSPGAERYRVWPGTMPVSYRYTAGVAGQRFLSTLKDRGRLAVTRCAACGLTYLPPRLYCERCFSDLSQAWSEVEPTGRVHTFAVVHADLDGHRLPHPEVVALVRIDGTDGGLVSRLVQVSASDVFIDMPVRAVLRPPRRRTGTLADIVGFAPRG